MLQTLSGEYPFQRLLAEGINSIDLLKEIEEKDLNPSDYLPKLYNGEPFSKGHKELLEEFFKLHFDKRPSAKEAVEKLEKL